MSSGTLGAFPLEVLRSDTGHSGATLRKEIGGREALFHPQVHIIAGRDINDNCRLGAVYA